jgi:DNA-binding GntR family transcriptional regulator
VSNSIEDSSGDSARATTDRVYRKLRELIIHNEIPIGAKINQSDMAARLGSSRTPVVNALHKLQSEGLVDNVPHTGFFVHRVTAKELVDLFSLREALDGAIIDDLVENATSAEIDQLGALFEQFRYGGPIDPVEYREADIAFHRMLIDLTDNDIAKKVNENFVILDRSFIAGLVRPPEETLKEHLEVIEALRDRDREKTRMLMVDHIGKTKTLLREAVRSLRNLRIDPSTIPIDQVDVRHLPK